MTDSDNENLIRLLRISVLLIVVVVVVVVVVAAAVAVVVAVAAAVIVIIQFNSSLLMCQINSQMANYTNSTTQITTDNEQVTNEIDTTTTNKQTNRECLSNYLGHLIMLK
jgi:uncharacterized protein YpuA (DUF1002 family)